MSLATSAKASSALIEDADRREPRSPAKYTFQALSIAQLEGSRLEPLLDEAALRTPSTVAANIGVLAGFYVLFAVTTMFALARKRERR